MNRQTIFALCFVSSGLTFLLMSPGSLLRSVSNTGPNFSLTFADSLLIDSDNPEIIALRKEARSAMIGLETKHSQRETERDSGE